VLLILLTIVICFQWRIDEKPVKIDKWDGAAVKNSLDDAAKKVCIQYNEWKNVHRQIS
jgi:hypothetical protein